MRDKILIIDDDIDMCCMLVRFLDRHDFEVNFTISGKNGMEELEKNQPNLVICDCVLRDTNGKELLLKIKTILPDVPVIVITAYGEIKVAVEMIKFGAFDYIIKPLFPEEFLTTIYNAIESSKSKPQVENLSDLLPMPIFKGKKYSNYIFRASPEFKEILRQMDLVAPTNYSVIIFGESGSGKEVIAQEIHARSQRKCAPFIAIDCGVLSFELADRELFGDERGSFKEASNPMIGSMELANGGTIFFDEISNLSSYIQASLLRMVKERKFRRVGGINDIDLDIRIIVASNTRLVEAVKMGHFRADLFHSFNEFSISVPPLRERKNDILTFAQFFLEQSNEELNKNLKGFSQEVKLVFKAYNWPGNIRELKNIVKRSALLSKGEYIDLTTMPLEIVNLNS